MKRIRIATVVLATAASVAIAAEPPKQPFDQAYGVVVDRNPFVRDRVKPRTAEDMKRDSDRNRRPPKTAAQSLVLRGVTIEDAQLHAYFEDTRSSSAVRVAPGDPLGDGRVADVEIDAVAFEQNGRTVWVEVGENLTGGQSDTGAADPAASQPTTGPSAVAGTPAPPLPPGASMADRMKARRSQMTGGKK